MRTYAVSAGMVNGRPRAKNISHKQPGPPLSSTAIRFRVTHAALQVGVDRVREGPVIEGRRTVSHEVHPHIFRRWWKSRMRKARVTDSELLNYMIGHRPGFLRYGGAYDQFDPDYIRREYSKAEPLLTVMTNVVSYGAGSHMEANVPEPYPYV